jgi:hypothetical protein
MSFTSEIANRVVGQYPLSIPTSLAIEAANGIHPDIVSKDIPIAKYQELWVNLRTLFRNFMGSLDKNVAAGIDFTEVAAALSDEMDNITNIIGDSSKQGTRVIFYVSNYKFTNQYKHGVPRVDTTPGQKEYTALQNAVLKVLINTDTSVMEARDLRLFDLKITPLIKTSALFLTHYPFDILSHNNFSKFSLLESHTGAIKNEGQWYTKYYNGKELAMIPFRDDFIQIFGDAESFRPMAHNVRKELIELATHYKWSSVTTKDKIIYSLNQMRNHFLRDTIKSILM